jgi:UDP-galactopyranose mutase
MIEKQNVYIIGYSLEAAYKARILANKGKKITFLQTGKLGYPLDDIRDYISYEDILVLKSLDINFEIEALYNSTYTFIPYEQLKFVNNRNGLVNWPLNKSSFDSAEEWEQMEFNLTKLDEFRQKLESSTNYINIYKNFFPKWLYDSLIKHVGVNKWGGQRQSKLSKDGIAREIDLSCMNSGNTGNVYRPLHGYESVCTNLLDHPNITISTLDFKQLHKLLITRHKAADVIMMDNRIDGILEYMYGNFERVVWTSEKITTPHIEEFIDIADGIVFTPTKDYWCTTNRLGDIIQIKTRVVDEMPCRTISEICPTTANKKIYAEYKKIVNLYSGKILDLDKLFSTVIS